MCGPPRRRGNDRDPPKARALKQAGVTMPDTVAGVKQMPLAGVSMAYNLNQQETSS